MGQLQKFEFDTLPQGWKPNLKIIPFLFLLEP